VFDGSKLIDTLDFVNVFRLVEEKLTDFSVKGIEFIVTGLIVELVVKKVGGVTFVLLVIANSTVVSDLLIEFVKEIVEFVTSGLAVELDAIITVGIEVIFVLANTNLVVSVGLLTIL